MLITRSNANLEFIFLGILANSFVFVLGDTTVRSSSCLNNGFVSNFNSNQRLVSSFCLTKENNQAIFLKNFRNVAGNTMIQRRTFMRDIICILRTNNTVCFILRDKRGEIFIGIFKHLRLFLGKLDFKITRSNIMSLLEVRTIKS